MGAKANSPTISPGRWMGSWIVLWTSPYLSLIGLLKTLKVFAGASDEAEAKVVGGARARRTHAAAARKSGLIAAELVEVAGAMVAAFLSIRSRPRQTRVVGCEPLRCGGTPGFFF